MQRDRRAAMLIVITLLVSLVIGVAQRTAAGSDDDPAAAMTSADTFDRLLGVIERDIVPVTRTSVAQGNKLFYELSREERPDPNDLIFLATHEPCPLCLSAITWGGYDNFFYLFSFEDSRDSFDIPHDLRILKEVFTLEPGGYASENTYWTSYDLMELLDGFDQATRRAFRGRIVELNVRYAELSAIYQGSKGDSDIPLK